MLQNVIIRLSQFVPQSLRSSLAASSYGDRVRATLNRLNRDPFPIVAMNGLLGGQRMRVNWANHKTYVFGTHEPHIMKVMRDLIQPGWTAVDAGAHIGYSTLLMAKCAGPTGKILAFEPLAQNYKLLVENIDLNGHKNIVAENLALLAQPGSIELRSATPGAMTWVASTHLDASAAVETQRVEGVTLDDYVQKHGVSRIDFVKMDVEGAEGEVLAGMSASLRRDKPTLLIELHGVTDSEEKHPAVRFLRENGYTIQSLGSRNWERHIVATSAS
jgi:FkbM family methyltransferase